MKKFILGLLLLVGLCGPAVEASYVPRVYKSLQHKTITLGLGVGSNTVGITAVDTNYATLVPAGCNGGAGSGDMVQLQITSGTVVTATRTWTNASITCNFDVLEYSPFFVTKVQRNTISLTLGGAGTSNTATLSTSIDTTKTILKQTGCQVADNASGALNNWIMSMTLTNATTVTGVADGASGLNLTCAFETVTFK